jgi:hypothetical protein
MALKKRVFFTYFKRGKCCIDNVTQNISEENIKELHKELMKDRAQWGDDGLYSPGQFKSF